MAKMRYCMLLLLFCAGKVYSDVLCESGFCRAFEHDPGCASPRIECGFNNATHSGLWLPSPTICNCCIFCLPFIVEGGPCSRGGPGVGTSVGRCGNGLSCRAADDKVTCQRMVSDCHTAQDNFDTRHLAGQTGALEERPECDGKGKYAAFSCVPTQTCFCQSEEGKRIFGEVLYRGDDTKQNMHCGCARFHEKIKKNIQTGVPNPVQGPRCTPDGNFHPIQCLDRTCYCVDTRTGLVREGANMEVDLDLHPLTRLECYDPNMDLYPEQHQGGPPYNITTSCLDNMNSIIQVLEESREAGYNVDFFSTVPGCLPDGTFGRISTTINRNKICVDSRGQRIGDYEAEPDTPAYENMDCKCAYTSHVVMASEPEQPVCCSNGNFRRIQCRRGMCRCVDSDGRQTGTENADPMFLPCFSHDWRNC